jgi:hypothetical protein
MFSSVEGIIESVKITGDSSISGNTNVGAIAGSLTDSGVVKWSSTGSGVNVYGNIDSEDETDTSNNIGGLVGYSDGGSIQGSINNATVSALESNSVGGVIGYAVNVTNLNNIYNTSEIEGKEYVGGIVGQMHEETVVTGSVNQGEITGELNTGGIAGLVDDSSITSTYNKGIIEGQVNTGGIAGKVKNESSLSKVYNTNENTTLDSAVSEGSVESTMLSTYGQVTGDINTGGLVGDLSESTIDTAYNAGNITGVGDHTGGLVGYMESGSITNAYNADNNTVIYKDGLLNAGVTDTTNVDYNGFNYNGEEYTYSHETGLYTKTSDGSTYDVGEIDIEAPIEDRANNIRLAYKDANVVGASFVGGLVGKVEAGTISKSYNAGNVSTFYTITGASSTVGALVGVIEDGSAINNSYYVTENQDNTVNLSN